MPNEHLLAFIKVRWRLALANAGLTVQPVVKEPIPSSVDAAQRRIVGVSSQHGPKEAGWPLREFLSEERKLLLPLYDRRILKRVDASFETSAMRVDTRTAVRPALVRFIDGSEERDPFRMILPVPEHRVVQRKVGFPSTQHRLWFKEKRGENAPLTVPDVHDRRDQVSPS